MKVVFLLEERSAQSVLRSLVPRICPDLETVFVPHEGKTDLRKSLPRKLKGWTEPGVRFVVVHDQDAHSDCQALKEDLMAICRDAGRPDTIVRIVCRNLESWYLGDFSALAKAYEDPRIVKRRQAAKFRNPDALSYPTEELRRLIPGFKKIEGAERVAPFLSLDQNTSLSFRAFVEKIRALGKGPQPL